LDSPSGPKLKKKKVAEPTMTLHTRAATDDIYDIFNAPLKPALVEENDDDDEDSDSDDMTDGDYASDAESTGATRQLPEGKQVGDEASDIRSFEK
jgi:checkpoint serine/threonine-protein kinase